MNLVALVFSTGWASGVNAYLVVLVLGLADRFGDLEQIPDGLSRTWVLAGAGALYALEFVTDKIPYVDSTWDAISTVIRPTVAGIVGALAAGQEPGANQAAYAILSAVVAFASHAVKSGGRLAINTSPEPVTNIGASLGEDVTVLGVTVLVINHPVLALGLTATLLVVGLVVLFFALRWVRRGWRRWQRRSPGTGPGTGSGPGSGSGPGAQPRVR